MNPLKSVTGTIVAGFIMAVIVILIFKDGGSHPVGIVVWIHAMVGVTWIGLLYYFNFVQVPGVATALSEADSGGPGAAAINKYIAPTALLWFRWAALATWVSGAVILARLGILGDAFMHRHRRLDGYHNAIQRLGIDLAKSEENSWPRR